MLYDKGLLQPHRTKFYIIYIGENLQLNKNKKAPSQSDLVPFMVIKIYS